MQNDQNDYSRNEEIREPIDIFFNWDYTLACIYVENRVITLGIKRVKNYI